MRSHRRYMKSTSSDTMLTNRSTSGERISSVTWRAATNWIVVDHFASRSNAASSRTRVSAFLTAAGLVPTAVGVHYAFRSASRRAADVTRNARADGLSVHSSALTVRAARRWTTRFRIGWCYKQKRKIVSTEPKFHTLIPITTNPQITHPVASDGTP